MADKKISELPLLSSVSGSSIIIPIVHDGTTVKLNLSQLGHYASQWSAQTGSANTFTGTQSIIGNVNISGKLTVNSIEAVYETSSVLFTTGSTQIGDQITDVHTIIGTVNLNGLALGTNELMAQTASQAAVNLRISSTTGSINTTTSSFDSVFLRISSVTGSINVQSSSQDLVNRGISSVTGAMNTTTSSFNSEFNKIGSTTASIHFTTSSLNAFTGSIIGQNNTISTFTSSVNFATQSLNTQTGSQDLVNRGISSVTGSINTTTSSFDSVFLRISSTTGSINTTTSSFNNVFSAIGQQTASQDLVNRGISSVTGSINTTTSSFNSVFSQIGSTTSSLIGITNGLMAFTASLDNTYATDAQLYQLYQATASIHLATASLNTQTGSQANLNAQIGIATSSLNTFSGSIRSEINLLEAYTASLKAATIVSSSQQIQNYNRFALTSSANTFYGNQTIQGNLQLSATSPLVYNAGNTNAMLFGFFDGSAIYGPYYQIFGNNYTNPYQRGGAEFVYDTRNGGDGNFHVSSYNGSTWTQKFRVDDDGIEVTGSALVTGDVRANKFVFTDGVINTNVGGQYVIATSGNVTYLYTGTSGLNINDATNGNINVSISNVGVVQTRGKLTVGSPGNDQDIAFGGSNAKLDWAGTGAQIFYSVGALQFSSVGSTNNMILQQQAGALFNAGITGSLMATNNVVSSSAQVVNYNLFALTGSSNTFWGTQTFSGSVNVSGSTTFNGNHILSGSIAMSGSTIQTGNNTLIGNTILSGSILVSGSSDFKNSEFRVSGSSFFTGSHTITGNSTFSGSINIASGSSYYRAGNKLFNYGQWCSLETQSGSADTAYAIKLATPMGITEGFTVSNNGSGFPTRITATNTGLYNLQFSLQLNTTATETCDFSVWLAMTGSAVANSNTDFSINKTAGGGNGVAALNLLTQITAGDYIELYWSKTTANGQLQYKASQSTPTRPVTPSAIVTITQHA